MKIFVSHKDVDEPQARLVAQTLRTSGHEVYLDSMDPHVGKNGDDLASYLRGQLAKCEALLVVLSKSTQASWWVPWEIGVASERNYPLGTYQSDSTEPPEFLRKWPVLRTLTNVSTFAGQLSSLGTNIQRRVFSENKSLDQARSLTVPQFHIEVKRLIGQK